MSGDLLQRGRAAYARRAWDDAYLALSAAEAAAPLTVADGELLAWSAVLTGRTREFLQALERVHQAALDGGDGLRAARAAFWLASRLFALGETGRAGGWLVRAQRLVDREAAPCVEQGYLLLPAVQRSLATGDWGAAHDGAAAAAAIGERFADRDLISFARHLQGRALLRQGGPRLREGLALLDEAMVATTTGELSPVITGLIYCAVIDACHQIHALDRAREWTAALSGWCDAQPQLVSFSGQCMVHRAEVKQLAGDWADAAAESRAAAERIGSVFGPAASAEAIYQQGEIHRLRGEHEAAEALYRDSSARGGDPQPGLALLRLAQGDVAAAASGIRRALEATADPLRRSRLLPAAVEILLALGQAAEAGAACAELDTIAAAFDVDVLNALAGEARGAVRLAEGNATEALAPLRAAFAVWQQIGAPYLAARTRALIGQACRSLGDRDGAALELDAARAQFQRLGALPDLRRLDVAAADPPPPRHGLTARELQVLRLVASGKTNKVIARELHLSEKTVDRHVSNIFNKVDVASRAAATAYAYQHKLL